MIKVKNNRKDVGALYHFAHFLCDCLFPEIINDIYKYNEVVREKILRQTIGNFEKIYTDVMMIKNKEILTNEFNSLDVATISYKPKEEYINKIHFDKFRNFIFNRYKINGLIYDKKYPEVILVKRNERVSLIDDEYLKKINMNIKTGKERREIDNIDEIEKYLLTQYGDKFKSVFFENIPFEEQVKYFNNAKMIVCAHGAVMANMFFCKRGTKIIEVTCGKGWRFFNDLSRVLGLKHYKCRINEFEKVIDFIKLNGIISTCNTKNEI